ncbi:hypothetical protein SCALM49S_01942 [Streptomyces californicus]
MVLRPSRSSNRSVPVDQVFQSVVDSSLTWRTFSPLTWTLTDFVPGAGFGPLE